MSHEEKVNANSCKVSCDGGIHGHPLIYLDINSDDQVTCPYCGRIFVYTGDNSEGS